MYVAASRLLYRRFAARSLFRSSFPHPPTESYPE